MVRVGHVVLAAAMTTAMGTPVAAEVLDATYRGTMVCDKLPFTSQQMREAIEVTRCATIMWCGCAMPRSTPRPSRARERSTARKSIFRAAQRQAQGHADLERRRQDRDPGLRGRDQAAAEGIPTAGQEVGGSWSDREAPIAPL